MNINVLTPTGYKPITDCEIGQELIAYELGTGNVIINHLEKKEIFSPDMFQDEYQEGWMEWVEEYVDEEGNLVEGYDTWHPPVLLKTKEQVFEEIHGPMTFYLVNGTYKLFKNQGVWTYQGADFFVNVASQLQVGDIIFDDLDQDVTITSIEEITEPYWWRLTVSGDATYVADGLTLHNASRYWVNTGTNANWNASPTTNWSATSGSAVKAAIPTSTDDVTFDGAGSGNSASTISANITVLSFTVTGGYTNTITHNAVLTVAGNVTLNTSYTIAGTSLMSVSATSTITSNGKTWPNNLRLSGSVITIAGNLVVTGQLELSGINFTINKTTTETITCNGINKSNASTGTAGGTIKVIITGGTWTSAGNASATSFDIDIQGNVTLGSNLSLSGGVITYVSGTVTTTGNDLTLRNDITLNTNGVTWNNIVLLSITVTINSLLTVSGTLSANTGFTLSGTSGFSASVLSITNTIGGTITLKEGITYIITSSLSAYLSRVGSALLFTSAHASTKAILTLQNGATCNVLANFTRIDASGGRPIRGFNSTVTDCINIQSFNDLKTITSVG